MFVNSKRLFSENAESFANSDRAAFSKFDDGVENRHTRIFCNDEGVMLRRVIVMKL